MNLSCYLNLNRIGGFLVCIVVVWCLTGKMRLLGKLNSGDARKINHVIAFVGGAAVFGWLTPEIGRLSALLTGAVLMVFVFITCLCKKTPPFSWIFAANTRESDAPNEEFYFWTSWLSSLSALFVVELFVWDLEITRLAAVIVGVGDGFAEPIGKRFGRHPYHVPSFRKNKLQTRTLEGSGAVLIGTFICVVLCSSCPNPIYLPALFSTAAVIALSVTITEALTPHGLDNVTIAITSAVLLTVLK